VKLHFHQFLDFKDKVEVFYRLKPDTLAGQLEKKGNTSWICSKQTTAAWWPTRRNPSSAANTPASASKSTSERPTSCAVRTGSTGSRNYPRNCSCSTLSSNARGGVLTQDRPIVLELTRERVIQNRALKTQAKSQAAMPVESVLMLYGSETLTGHRHMNMFHPYQIKYTGLPK
jgi:hypothetical protein